MMGMYLFEGSLGLKRDVSEAVKLLHRAAELGDPRAHDHLGGMYYTGDGVGKDQKKAIHHWRIAAIGGDLDVRCNLAELAYLTENVELAMKHWIIAAEAGHDQSLNDLKLLGYKAGHVTKDAFAKALRAHQSANDEAKSENRDRFVKFRAQNPHLFIN
jgi:TPR repeat protein